MCIAEISIQPLYSAAQVQDEQDKLLTLLDASAALASAAGAAAKLGDEDGVAGLRGGPRGVRRVAAAAARPEHFILSIAACKVHQERPDPRRATATLDQQRCVPPSSYLNPPVQGSCTSSLLVPQGPTQEIVKLAKLLCCYGCCFG